MPRLFHTFILFLEQQYIQVFRNGSGLFLPYETTDSKSPPFASLFLFVAVPEIGKYVSVQAAHVGHVPRDREAAD